VIDDGSTDETAERLAAYASQALCIHQPNSGGYVGAARNAGMARATGEYLAFLDADDIMLPGRIRRQVDFLSTHPEVGLVFSDYRNFSRQGLASTTHFEACALIAEKLAGREAVVLCSAEATAHLARENFSIPSTAMMRRKVLDVVPGFCSILRNSEDFRFFYLIARNFAVAALGQLGALRRLHDNNMSGDSIRALRNYVASRTQLRDSEPSAENISLLNEFIYGAELQLARVYADRREFTKTLAHNIRALRWSASLRFQHVRRAVWMLMRTAAIALKLKPSGP